MNVPTPIKVPALTREGLKAAMTAPASTPPPKPATVAPLPTPMATSAPIASPTAAIAAANAVNNAAGRPTLTPQLFEKFAKLIYELSGMKFEANKSYFLASKIDNRVQALGLKNIDDYVRYLDSPSGRTEYGFLVDEVTINETFFYRHEPQLLGFITEILRPLFTARKTQGARVFRILSAAASTGDELYTIALILKDQGLLGQGVTFELMGTDISHEALKKARDGVYKKYNVRNIPPAILQQNFTTGTDDTFLLKAEVKSMCKFQEMNLMDATRMAALGKFDIIFVRNVLIYFDEKSKEQVVTNLCSILHDDGFVIMGHSENVYSQRHLLRPDKTKVASLAHVKAPPGTPKL